MKNHLFITIIARINFGIISILLLDTFIFKPVTVVESFREAYSTRGGSTPRSGVSRYYLAGEGDQIYKVPESVYIEMNHERSQYLIYKSLLFKRPLKIRYVFENSTRQQNLNILNGIFGEVITLFIFIISLLNITRKPFLRKEQFNQKAIPFCSILLCWILYFYFAW